MESLRAGIAALLIVGLAGPAAVAQERPRVLAVLAIEDEQGKLKADDVAAAGDFLRATLARDSRYSVVDKGRQEEKRKAVLAEMKKESQELRFDEKYRVRLGRELAADSLLSCSLAGFGKTCILTCEQFTLETGVAEAGATAEFPCSADGLLAGVKQVSKELTGGTGKNGAQGPGTGQAPTGTGSGSASAPSPGRTLKAAAGITLVEIGAGCFMMGSPSGEPEQKGDEYQHKVCLTKSFYMGTTEITQGQWSDVVGRNPSMHASGGSSCPVENVSWDEVVAFCNKLSDRDGLSRCYKTDGLAPELLADCKGYRLPTEAEWEFAARAGTVTPFSTGNCINSLDQANFDGRYPLAGCDIGKTRSKTVAAGTFAANPLGVFDLCGNVSEWVWDLYAEYPLREVTDPLGPEAGTGRVIRGGAFDSGAGKCRSANREQGAAGFRAPDVGFRVVRTAK